MANGVNYGALPIFYYYPVLSDLEVIANFEPNLPQDITANAGVGGTITPSGITSVAYESGITYILTPDPGYLIDQITVDGIYVGRNSTYTLSNVTAPHTIQATFMPDSFSITASVGQNGTMSPLGTTTIANGGSQIYTITSNTGYIISDVLIDGVSIGTTFLHSFVSVSANHTIHANFITEPVAPPPPPEILFLLTLNISPVSISLTMI